MKTHYSYWLKQALADDSQKIQTLNGNIDADVAIVGGGYTGLWTAIELKQKQPQLKVVIIERDRVGSGASGYNGGCLLTWSTKYPTLKKLFGEQQARWLVAESERAIFEIEQFCQQHEIDAELRCHGSYYTATNPAQSGGMQPVIAELERLGINSWQSTNPQQLPGLTGSAVHKEGYFSPAAGSVQPAKLARGLMRVAQELGVEIYEQTAMRKLSETQPAKLHTDKGVISAKQVVLATNAWMLDQFPEFKRNIVVVSSDMVITKPVPDALAANGPQPGATVVDSRIFVHYYRDTLDGRLMLGKGGNHFSFANKVSPMFKGESRYRALLERSFAWLFPQLSTSDIQESWTGGSDRSTTGLPFFGSLHGHGHIYYGLGYSGNGVAQTRIGGKILASLTLGEDNAYTRCGLNQGPRGNFPPEPLRWLGAMMVRNAVRRKEHAEQAERRVSLIDRWLAELAGPAGKADKL